MLIHADVQVGHNNLAHVQATHDASAHPTYSSDGHQKYNNYEIYNVPFIVSYNYFSFQESQIWSSRQSVLYIEN